MREQRRVSEEIQRIVPVIRDSSCGVSPCILQYGGASALAFFLDAYASASPTVKGACTTDGDCPAFAAEAWVVVLFSAEAIIGFLVASKLYKKKIKTWSDCARDGGGSDSDEALHDRYIAMENPVWHRRLSGTVHP